ncbi:MAG: Uma2 family endonuclease [Isosphaeraceae bacterium]
MSSVTLLPPVRTLTAEELMALPDDGISRELILGELREQPMTRRNWKHSGTEATIAKLLGVWLDEQPEPRGMVHSGEAGFRLLPDPETFVGIDVAYASAELVARRNPALPFYDGPPALAVEILSPSDQHGDVVEKIGLYLEVGAVAWLVDPDFQTVQIHRPGQEPETFNVLQELSGEPYLPGFRVPVARIFGP